MNEPTLTSTIVDMLPVVIGGGLAIFGGVIGQFITHKRSRKTLYREKAEQLVQSLYDHKQWLTDKQNTRLFRQENHDVPSPLNEVQMIQKLYFPMMKDEIHDIFVSTTPMEQFINEQHLEQMKDRTDWLATYDTSQYNDMYKIYYGNFNVALDKMRTIITKYI